jgi:hypothetical protein
LVFEKKEELEYVKVNDKTLGAEVVINASNEFLKPTV